MTMFGHSSYSKVSRNRKTTKSLEKVIICKGYCCFSCFLTLLENVGRLEGWKACVTVFERQSHLSMQAEGRPGPSYDNDDFADFDSDRVAALSLAICIRDDGQLKNQ